jgi:hypothetical protein
MFETDKKKEKEGVWLDFGVYGKFLVARAGGSNKVFAKQMELRSRPYKARMDKNTLDESEASKLMIEIFVDTIILGWEGVYNRAGELIEYTRQNAIQVFTDLPDLFQSITEQSMEMSNYLVGQTEEDSKN